jgi:hypothetical protein
MITGRKTDKGYELHPRVQFLTVIMNRHDFLCTLCVFARKKELVFRYAYAELGAYGSKR